MVILKTKGTFGYFKDKGYFHGTQMKGFFIEKNTLKDKERSVMWLFFKLNFFFLLFNLLLREDKITKNIYIYIYIEIELEINSLFISNPIFNYIDLIMKIKQKEIQCKL